MDFDFEDVWGRVMQVTGWSKQAELAVFLGITNPSVHKAKKRGGFPPLWAIQVAQAFGISTDWLLSGEGPMSRGEQPEHPGCTKPESVPETVADTVEYDEDDEEELTLDEFWQAFFNIAADPAWRGWYRIELIKRFPELTERVKKQREVDRKDELARTKVVGE